jgi:hypothetical protein
MLRPDSIFIAGSPVSDKYLGDNLIFIISLPRSGSTLLQRVLGGHDDVVTSSEPWIMLHPVYGRRDTGISTEYSADWAALGVNEFLEHYTDGPDVYDDGIRAFANTIYSNALQKGGGTRFIDKTPRYVLIIDELLRLFPEAKFIFLIRNPLSVLSSIINTQIANDLWTLERFSDELIAGPAAILGAIEKLGDKAITVRYEDFVMAPEKNLEHVCSLLELNYEPGMLEYDNSAEIAGFMQDRTGIHQHSRPEKTRAESWRDLLSDPQQLHFAQSYLRALGRETVDALGYPYDELTEAVRSAAERNRSKGRIFPWHVAIKHLNQLGGRDHLVINSYRNHRDYGPVKANIRTVQDFCKSLWRNIAFVFRGG